MSVSSGYFPVFENQFQIKDSTYVDIKGCSSFAVSLDNGVEEWQDLTEAGWTKRLMTAKSISISINMKREIGDSGNDAIAALAFKTGQDAQADFKWTLPSGESVELVDAVVNVTGIGGDPTNVEAYEVEVMSNGKPTFTPAQ